jgi:hypothetical protein
MHMSISGISGLSGAAFVMPTRFSAAEAAPEQPQVAAAAKPAIPVTGEASVSLSPSVLAALLGQELKLFGSSFGA